jgi:hypothetical protein
MLLLLLLLLPKKKLISNRVLQTELRVAMLYIEAMDFGTATAWIIFFLCRFKAILIVSSPPKTIKASMPLLA